METSSRFLGWFLLLFGVAIICWTFYSSYNIFTGKTPVPEVFPMAAFESKSGTSLPDKTIKEPSTPQEQMEKMLQEQIKEVVPTDILPRLLNLISWSIFAGIMIFGGAQVATLGIKLMK